MLYEGIVRLVQGNSGVSSLAATGGFLNMLPKDTVLPSWSYTVVHSSLEYTLLGAAPNTCNLQIDAYADTAAAAINLARAIDNVLQNYRGTLSDVDSTIITSCLKEDGSDMTYFDDEARSYRWMSEYQIWFV